MPLCIAVTQEPIVYYTIGEARPSTLLFWGTRKPCTASAVVVAGGGAPKGKASGSHKHGLYTKAAKVERRFGFGFSPAMPGDNEAQGAMKNRRDRTQT
jgi:hypothetical protein